ncbi:MAG TPA: DUF2889 domain-containing protein [Ramlibacter sp.]|nr:DUF2889 domain-containing protein [Ramlibacter sp.]
MNAEGLPEPAARELLHQRKVHLCGYRRDDGLWDIEAAMTDQRSYESRSAEKGRIPAGDPVHHICVRLTVDDNLTVKSVAAAMKEVPYHTCPGALGSLATLEGATLSRGWRRRIEEGLGGTQGCTHVRDLLLQAATVAFQTIPVAHAQVHGDILPAVDGQPPPHLGTCRTWALDGPVVARLYPEFAVLPPSKPSPGFD